MNEQFYTLDEETRELVANPISIGNGLFVIMQIDKRYITGKIEDKGHLVNIKLGDIANISYQLQRKTTADYVAGRKDANSFSRGHVLGNGRMLCSVIDRELLHHIFCEIQEEVGESALFKLNESEDTFGGGFEVEEKEEGITSETAIGGSNPFFSKQKTYMYLDDLPVFDIRILARADAVTNVKEYGDQNGAGVDSFKMNKLYENKIQRISFVNDSGGANAVDPIRNQAVQFIIFGNVTGWKEMK